MFVRGSYLLHDRMLKQLVIIIALSFTLACSSDRIGPLQNYGAEYFPLKTGDFRIYQVDQTVYELGTASTTNFQLKESVVDSFTNQSGGFTYTIHREIWDDAQQTWDLSEVWSARLSDTEAILVEGNTQYLKLKFPLVADKKWDGNLYNTMDEETYTADSIDLIYIIDEQTNIEHTITVVQKNNLDKIVETDYRIEKYAPEIGLIYKETINLIYCTSTDSCLGQQVIESGITYKQAMIASGNE